MHKVHTQFNRLIVEATQRWWVPGCSRRSSLADGSRKHHTLPPAKAGHCEKWLAWVFFNLSEKNPQISQIHEIKTSPPEIFWRIHEESSNFFPNFIQSLQVRRQSYKAKETKAAEPMAKPFPMAAVVFPAASKASVRRRTSGLNKAISLAETCIERTGKFKDREIQNGRKQAFSNKKHPKLFKTSTLCRT